MPGFSEKDFEREEDARSLMRVAGMRSDPKRMKAAQKELAKMEKEAKAKSLEIQVAKKLKAL